MSNVNIEIQELKQMIADLVLSQKETDRMLSEKFKETDAKFKETDRVLSEKFQETDRVLSEKFRETDKRVKQAFDLFEGQWGKLMEALIEGGLVALLQAHGIGVHKTSMRVKGTYQGHNYEFDIIAHNSDELVITEVKTTLRVRHVKDFIDQLKQVKTWMPEYQHMRVYGAVAFLKSEEEAETFAQKQKLFAIRAVGDSAHLLNPPGFQPASF